MDLVPIASFAFRITHAFRQAWPALALGLGTAAATAGSTVSVTGVTGTSEIMGGATNAGVTDTFEESGSVTAFGESSQISGSAAQGSATSSASASMQTSAILSGFNATYTLGALTFHTNSPADSAYASLTLTLDVQFDLAAPTRLYVSSSGGAGFVSATFSVDGPEGQVVNGNHNPVTFEGDVPAGAYLLHISAVGGPPGLPEGGFANAFANMSFDINTRPVHNITQGTDWPAIQLAIDAADSGDELHVGPGTYHETIDLLDKDLWIVGETGDPADAVIDGQGSGSVVRVAGGQTVGTTLLNALTITGGSAPVGGGILIDGASADIGTCIVMNNTATAAGGGIAVVRAPEEVRIIGARIEGNTVRAGLGGGLYMGNSEVFLNGSTVSGNSATGGGGLYMGGNSLLRTEYCIYGFNVTDFAGSAFLNQGGSLEMNSCLFNDNAGGDAALTVELGASAIVTGATFTRNTGGSAGAITGFGSTILVSNSILFGDTLPEIEATGAATVNDSLVAGGWSGPGSGNIDADPGFVDSTAGNFRLADGSPCLDAGDNGAPRVFLEDLDRLLRIRNCRVDMGAYESPFFADCNGNGIGDGCDVAPIVDPEFDHQIEGWEVVLVDGQVEFSGGTAIITGPDADFGTPPTAIIQPIPGDAATVTFVLLSYESADDGNCGAGGSFDFPFFTVNDLLYPLNQDGTLAPPTAGTFCGEAGSITNINPPPAPVTFVVDLDGLVGAGPYVVGVGVLSVDSAFGPGTAVYDSLFATTDVADANGDGVPDVCACPWDLNGNGTVNTTDFLNLLQAWGANPGGPPDFNGDGTVNTTDFLALLQHWGPCP